MSFSLFRNPLSSRSRTRPGKGAKRSQLRYRPELLTLEGRIVPSSIVWTNRGQAADGFAAVFGANANLARSDVDAALGDWANLISNFNYSSGPNTFNVSISIGGTGFGFNTSYGGGFQINGKPNQASIGIGGGSDGHGAGYYLDPTPSSYEEFEGTIINPSTLSATPGGPADGKVDLYSRITTAFPLAAGINDASNELFTSDPNHYLTNTGHADAVCPGTLWTYHGPDVSALLSSDSGCNSNRPNALQVALPSTSNQVTSGGVTYFGADDVGAWALIYSSRRYLPSNLAAQILHDSYGYTINPPTSHSAYIDYNPTTHNVLVRGGSHGTGTYPSQNNPSNDTITIATFSIPFPVNQTFIEFDVQVGNPTPGTGPNPTYAATFLANSVSSITVNTTDGVDTVNIQNTNALFAAIAPITVNLGSGTTTVNILNLPPFAAPITVNLGSGTDTVNVQATFATVTVNGGTGTDTVNVQSTSAAVTIALASSNATVNLGSNGSVQGIQAAVTIDNPVGHHNVINVDDSADSAAHTNVLLDSFTPGGDTPFGRITNLAPAAINYEFADTNTLNVKMGTGTTVVNVQATGAGTTNLFSNGPTTVNVVGNGNTLEAIGGALNLENEVSFDTVNINDQNDTTFQTATMTTVIQRGSTLGRISGLAGAPIAWDYPDTTMVTINTGRAGARVTVLGTGVPTFLNGNTLGTNALVGANLETTWNVTGANAGNFSNVLASATFTGFQNLTGGSDNDGFVFSNGATLSGTLDGGGGGNGLNLQAYTTDLTVNITGGNAGNVPGVVGAFRNISGVATGSGNDRFIFSNGAGIGSIDGGGGSNTLDASAYTRSLTVLISGANGGSVFGVVGFANIQNVTTGSGNDTVIFSDGGSLAGTLDGSGGTNTIDSSPDTTSLLYFISAGNGGSVAGVLGAFADVQNVIGAGAGSNDFAFADGGSLAGYLDGGVGGNNTLDYTTGWSGNVLVNLQTGAASGLGGLAPGHLANIQNVLGASGGGTFFNILVGNGGNYLQGGNGRRNLLVAGGSASVLQGGNDDDILIGGITAYDGEADMHSFVAIMTYWSGTTDDYFTRVNNLTTGNGVPLLDASMVFNNGGGNTLLGNNGGAAEMNLFYGLDPSLETTDYNPGIGEVFINV